MQILLVAFFLLLPVIAQADPAGSGSNQAVSNSVKGDILYVDGEYLVVKEVSGKETRVHVNGETRLNGVAGKLKAGDKVEATVTAEGHATTVALQGVESLPPLGPR
jgi:hypothetical protein